MDNKGNGSGNSASEVRKDSIQDREGEPGSNIPTLGGEDIVRQTRLALTVKRGEELFLPEAGITIAFSERRSSGGEFRVIVKAPSNVQIKRRKSEFTY